MKKYIDLKKNGSATHLKIELYYYLGGTNYFTGRAESRGYYLSVSPVTRQDRGGWVSESYTAFTGAKKLVKPVTRKSAKAEAEAEAEAARIENALISWVCEKNGLPLPEVVQV